MRHITLEDVRALDGKKIRQDPHHRRAMLLAVRAYFAKNRNRGFADYNLACSDEEFFLYAYAKYSMARRDDPAVIERVKREYDLWQFKNEPPIYLISYYRLALESRLGVETNA